MINQYSDTSPLSTDIDIHLRDIQATKDNFHNERSYGHGDYLDTTSSRPYYGRETLLQNSDTSLRETGGAAEGKKHGDRAKSSPVLISGLENEFKPSTWHRFGNLTIVWLSVTPLIIIGVLGFIAFLWFGNSSSSTWQKFMIREWVTRAVSVSSLVLRTCTSLQTGAAVAMLAAIALEHFKIPLTKAAAISVMRSEQTSARSLICHTVLHADRSLAMGRTYWFLTSILVITSILLEFTSTALLSDLRLGDLPGFRQNLSIAYDFDYNLMIGESETSSFEYSTYGRFTVPRSNWLREPPSYPPFAEYSSPAPVRSDVDDTGTLLRALLPMTSTQDRETVRNYTGKALVLDTRVACQQPLLDNLRITWNLTYDRSVPPQELMTALISGTYANSTASEALLTPGHPINFGCINLFGENDTTICQLNPSTPSGLLASGNPGGSLMSVFQPPLAPASAPSSSSDETSVWGAAYLISKWDIGSEYSMDDINSTFYPKLFSASGVWSNWAVTGKDGADFGNLSMTLCYSAFDVARLEVEIHSDLRRTEPLLPTYNNNTFFNFTSISNQLGLNSNIATSQERGILAITEKSSWLPLNIDTLGPATQPWVQSCADMAYPYNVEYWLEGNQSAFISSSINQDLDESWISPDLTIQLLFTELLSRNGSVAAALSALITILSSMAYYDQAPLFGKLDNPTLIYFETVLYPQSYRGFIAVVIVIVAHITVVTTTTILFFRYTRITMLGNAWQNVAQLVSPLTEDILATSSVKRDKDVARSLQSQGRNRKVQLGRLDDPSHEQEFGRYGLVSAEMLKRR